MKKIDIIEKRINKIVARFIQLLYCGSIGALLVKISYKFIWKNLYFCVVIFIISFVLAWGFLSDDIWNIFVGVKN